MQTGDFRIQAHKKIVESLSRAEAWFQDRLAGKTLPFYSSFDIRDSSFKAACVDANLFPAGFNNICDIDQQRASSLMSDYLKAHYPSAKKILLLAEEHTKNPYYWDNIFVIKSLIERGGYEARVCSPGEKNPRASGDHLRLRAQNPGQPFARGNRRPDYQQQRFFHRLCSALAGAVQGGALHPLRANGLAVQKKKRVFPRIQLACRRVCRSDWLRALATDCSNRSVFAF